MEFALNPKVLTAKDVNPMSLFYFGGGPFDVTNQYNEL